jgi:hypothetical protein
MWKKRMDRERYVVSRIRNFYIIPNSLHYDPNAGSNRVGRKWELDVDPNCTDHINRTESVVY